MEEQSNQDKEGFPEPNVHRLSESRHIFKPVLVKKLLADESDDDSDDQTPNDDKDDEEEEEDDLDGFHPLPGDATDMSVAPTAKADANISVENKVTSSDSSVGTVQESNSRAVIVMEIKRVSDINIANKESEQKSILNSYLKDSLRISDGIYTKVEEFSGRSDDKFTIEKPLSGAKRKNIKDSNDLADPTLQSQWHSKATITADERKSLSIKKQSGSGIQSRSYSPDVKRHSYHSIIANQSSDVKPLQFSEALADVKKSEKSERCSLSNPNKVSSEASDNKAQKITMDQIGSTKSTNSQSNVSLAGILDTPMKVSQGSTRPNPCNSHRNIFQTPQNKMSNEFAKNPAQTPATIFSHWSQQHMVQTPIHNPLPTSRESLQTPAVQSILSKHETPRYHSAEGKSVRRPLAETMFSAPPHCSQLSRLQEVPHESQVSPPVSRSNNNVQENIAENKPVYSSAQATHETKENRNPNPPDAIKSENNVGPPKVVFTDKLFSGSHVDKPKMEYQSNTYHNLQSSRMKENYENYQVRESQSTHLTPANQGKEILNAHSSLNQMRDCQSLPQPVTSQPEQLSTIQCSIPQKTNASSLRQKFITVKDRQYLILGILGQGMSCEVVRAQDLSNSELRAIKCVDLSKMDKDSVQGCLQEICMLDRLKAPCIVSMYSFEIRQPWLHVVMEVGDTDLSRLLKSMLQEKKKIPLTMILYYWTEMLTAVKHIHDNGVIHSDLKPANFLLVRGRLKLIDFGIASNINSDMTSVVKNCTIGTLNYISPEALVDCNAGNDSPNHNTKYKISYKSDVWSLGCILYGLVYGVTPFQHIRQQWAKVNAIADPKHKISIPLMTGSEQVPLVLVDVMRKCLQREPKARPTVAELLAIPYLQTNLRPPVPSIPPNIIMKLRQALSDEEWKIFSETLEKNVNLN